MPVHSPEQVTPSVCYQEQALMWVIQQMKMESPQPLEALN